MLPSYPAVTIIYTHVIHLINIHIYFVIQLISDNIHD